MCPAQACTNIPQEPAARSTPAYLTTSILLRIQHYATSTMTNTHQVKPLCYTTEDCFGAGYARREVEGLGKVWVTGCVFGRPLPGIGPERGLG
jgi:hypothetical protein